MLGKLRLIIRRTFQFAVKHICIDCVDCSDINSYYVNIDNIYKVVFSLCYSMIVW